MTEHYMSIAPEETEHKAALCDCKLVREDGGRVKLIQCKPHEVLEIPTFNCERRLLDVLVKLIQRKPHEALKVPTSGKIAKEFSEILLSWIGEAKMKRVVELNRLQANPSICHSHDFCDANMAMEEAFTNLGLLTPCDADNTPKGEIVNEFWGQVWHLAKQHEFNQDSIPD